MHGQVNKTLGNLGGQKIADFRQPFANQVLRVAARYLNNQRVAVTFKAHNKETASVYDLLHETKRPIAQVNQVQTVCRLRHKAKATVVLFAAGDLQFADCGNFQGKFDVQLQTGLILVDAFKYFFYCFDEANNAAVNGEGVSKPPQKLFILTIQQFCIALEQMVVHAAK